MFFLIFYLETSTQTEKAISVEKSQAPEQSAEQSTLKTMFESTSVFRRQFKIVGQIGQPNEKDKLTFTSLTRQIDSGLKQGYSEQEIVDGVIRAISAGMILRGYVETCQELSLDRLKKYWKTIIVLRIPLNSIKVLHLYVRDQKKHHKNFSCVL